MKAFFTVGVVAALLMIAPLELQAAPRGIASHAMGQAVEELKQLIQSMKEEAGANYYGGYYDQSAKSMGEAKADYIYDDQSAKSMGEAKADYIYDDQSAIEAAETQSHHELKSLKQFLESNLATAQVRGVQINNCGFIGTLLQLILQSALGPLSSSFGVLVDCRNARGCLQVRVDAPADVRKAEVNVCTGGELTHTQTS